MLSREEVAERLTKRLRTLHDRLALSTDLRTRSLLLDMIAETKVRLDRVMVSAAEQFESKEIDFDRPIPDDSEESTG